MYFLQKDDIMLHFTLSGSSDITGFQCLLSCLLFCLLYIYLFSAQRQHCHCSRAFGLGEHFSVPLFSLRSLANEGHSSN